MIEFATVARPYAKAFFELAEAKQQVATWASGLKKLAWLVAQPKVAALISQSDINAGQKSDTLLDLLDDEVAAKQTEFQNFVKILAVEKRLPVLPEINSQYQNLVLARSNTAQAVVYTAYAFTDESEKAKVLGDLEQHFNTKLQATFHTDPELIGGIKAVVGDRVLDLSVQAKLKKLYSTMTN